ncbi:hypothetical protein SLS54_004615 [Diplodia seriata]
MAAGAAPPPPPQPIPASHTAPSAIASLPASAPLPDILHILDRDGGIILTNLASAADLAAIDADVAAHAARTRSTEGSALHIIPKETLAVPGLVGKSPTVARLCEASPVLQGLRDALLRDRFSVIREDVVEEYCVEPLLSISVTLHIGFGAPRQRLHRDDNVHGVRHGGGEAFELGKVSQFGCLIAGSRTTRENGATMFVPGSHRWDDRRVPRIEEVCFAEMEPGSALVFLAACYHGGGSNSVPGEVRKMHGLFFVRGTLRTEENQFLAIPRSKLSGMSEKMLELLGYKKPETVLGIVDNDDPLRDLVGVLERANS